MRSAATSRQRAAARGVVPLHPLITHQRPQLETTPMALTAADIARADSETTRAWRAGDQFTRRLALLDLEVYGHDKIKPHAADLATRWKRSEAWVRSVATPDQIAR